MNREFRGVPIKKYFTNLVTDYVEVGENNPKYRCVKNRFHVYPVAKCFLLLGTGLWLLILGISFPWCIFFLWIPFFYFLFTVYAFKHENAPFMWPALIHSIALFLIWCIAAVVLFSTALFSTQTFLDTFGQGHHIEFAVRFFVVLIIKTIFVLVGVFLAYQVHIFYLCKKYFEQINKFESPLDGATELQNFPEKLHMLQSDL